MSQTTPNYPYATGTAEKPIIDALVEKYGTMALTWPIVLSGSTGETLAYLYERNAQNQINSQDDIRPKSQSNMRSYFINFASSPRVVVPPSEFLQPFLSSSFGNSYDYILQQQTYSTVDLDYVWYTGAGFKGFELTTFWVSFTSEAEARRLVSMMNRRPSWAGPNGAHAMLKIALAARDLNVDYYLVCANTVGRVGSALNTNGNVLFFPLTSNAITVLSNGQVPANATFCTFRQFLSWL